MLLLRWLVVVAVVVGFPQKPRLEGGVAMLLVALALMVATRDFILLYRNSFKLLRFSPSKHPHALLGKGAVHGAAAWRFIAAITGHQFHDAAAGTHHVDGLGRDQR